MKELFCRNSATITHSLSAYVRTVYSTQYCADDSVLQYCSHYEQDWAAGVPRRVTTHCAA